jgi:hypothetical protein
VGITDCQEYHHAFVDDCPLHQNQLVVYGAQLTKKITKDLFLFLLDHLHMIDDVEVEEVKEERWSQIRIFTSGASVVWTRGQGPEKCFCLAAGRDFALQPLEDSEYYRLVLFSLRGHQAIPKADQVKAIVIKGLDLSTQVHTLRRVQGFPSLNRVCFAPFNTDRDKEDDAWYLQLICKSIGKRMSHDSLEPLHVETHELGINISDALKAAESLNKKDKIFVDRLE